MWAWVRADGRTPRAAVQVRKVWAWMNRLRAYWAAVVRSGPAAVLARIAGSWCQSPNWRSSRRCGCPARVCRRRSSHSRMAAGLGAAARARASGFSGAAMAPVPSSSSRAAVQVTEHGPQSRLGPRRRPVMPVSVPHRRQQNSRVMPAQSRQIRTPSRRPGSSRPPVPQPGQVPATASAAVKHRQHRCP